MKQLLLILILLSVSWVSQADLLDRLRLEDVLKNRVEDAFRMYDPKAKALIRFDYKTFTGTLPGTSIETRGEINSFNIDSGDIIRVNIEVFTDLEQIAPEAKEYVLKVIPLEKSKVFVDYKKLKSQFPKEVPRPHLDPQALSTIAQETVTSFSSVFGVCLLVFLGFLFHQNSKKIKEFKHQVQLLTAALSDRAETSMALPSSSANAEDSRVGSSPSNDPDPLGKLSITCFKELFADCYWCHEDAYANWLWKNIGSDQKSELLSQISFMKEYSLYFVDLKPRQLAYHEHPYYLDPLGLLGCSQEDLSHQVKTDNSLWHFLSPMRQQNLPLNLEERLKAAQIKPESKKALPNIKLQSPPRTLETKLTWGNLTSEDENTLFNHPEMVPSTLRGNIRSLVWLAQKDEAFIQKVLARYDARSLASAWVGPENLLKKLESQLPEKKLKILLSYKEKMKPSRHSEAYTNLVAEGLKNEVA